MFLLFGTYSFKILINRSGPVIVQFEGNVSIKIWLLSLWSVLSVLCVVVVLCCPKKTGNQLRRAAHMSSTKRRDLLAGRRIFNACRPVKEILATKCSPEVHYDFLHLKVQFCDTHLLHVKENYKDLCA